MTALDVFEYAGQQVRTVVIDGEPWFVARDITAALGLSNGRDAISRLDQDGVGVADIIDSMGRKQSAAVINEAGLYELIFQSRVPGAVEFRRWVTHDVLPTIRKTGRYGSDVDMLAALPSSQLLALAAEAARRAEEAEARLAIEAPKAQSWDVLADASGTYTVSDAGKLLASGGCETGPRRIFEQLADMGWIFRRSGVWTGYQDKINAGHLAEIASSHRHPRTAERVLDAPQVRVTIAGLHALREIFDAAPTLAGLDMAVSS